MKKANITLSLLIILGFSAIASITTHAASMSMPNGTVIIGDKAYDLEYANDTKNSNEITESIVNGGGIYIKGFNEVWIDNITSNVVRTTSLPGVIYTSKDGVKTKYKMGDILDSDTTIPIVPLDVISIN
ncbi:hypothetical protein [Clostridium estertheticum]|uniref:hypothetical protein n=1 Tax=Clostridium estertheticum TaxID=238834 RepID=UPI001C0AB281|nr:hypothetical protein [Clostridium estertheticum]MBU3173370.1 hypothetical protein [Clostridium estertheticum]